MFLGPWCRPPLLLAVLLWVPPSVSAKDPEPVWLDQLPFGLVADPHGPPKRALSFNFEPIRVADRERSHGLGLHAPSDLTLRLAGHAKRFQAEVGLDAVVAKYRRPVDRSDLKAAQKYVYAGSTNLTDFYQGGTVVFRALVDGEERFNSGVMTLESGARQVDLDLTGAKTLRLVVEPTEDGSFADLAAWADAQLTGKLEKLRQVAVEHRPEAILVSHAGFLPEAAKHCLAPVGAGTRFTIHDAKTDQRVFRGKLAPVTGDWGDFLLGDFSAFRTPGWYVIRAGKAESGLLRIDPSVNRECLATHLSCFLQQRCGDPEHGWAKGCHLDDGRRRDNGQHQDVTGGWHDAGDLRRWGFTVIGLNALTEVAARLPAGPLRERMLAEARWGNRYFLAMQEPAGYVMNHIGGDVEKHGDNNRFTDNVSGNADDRVIDTQPGDPVCQFLFCASQARLAALSAATDPAYAQRCAEAGRRCLDWAATHDLAREPFALGASLAACAAWQRYQPAAYSREVAEPQLAALLRLQETNDAPVTGFFDSSTNRTTPAHQLHLGNWPLHGLLAFAETFTDSTLNAAAREALTRYLDGYLLRLQARNPFGIVPYALYASDPGGGRRIGRWYYRWCYVNNHDDNWWNGINPHIASTGAGLVRAARVLGRSGLARLGQRQLDFIYGANPFNASMVTGIGWNQPAIFKTSEFKPAVPEITGAVMAGIGSTREDTPVLHPGWWQTCEYWTPPLAWTMCLLEELQSP
jgi:hypothetical protein